LNLTRFSEYLKDKSNGLDVGDVSSIKINYFFIGKYGNSSEKTKKLFLLAFSKCMAAMALTSKQKRMYNGRMTMDGYLGEISCGDIALVELIMSLPIAAKAKADGDGENGGNDDGARKVGKDAGDKESKSQGKKSKELIATNKNKGARAKDNKDSNKAAEESNKAEEGGASPQGGKSAKGVEVDKESMIVTPSGKGRARDKKRVGGRPRDGRNLEYYWDRFEGYFKEEKKRRNVLYLVGHEGMSENEKKK
jgi:hypothetical protein